MNNIKLFILLFFMIFISSCENITSSIKSALNFKQAKVWLEKITFKASDDLNDSSPLVVHVLVVYSEDLLKDLKKMDSDAYFSKAQQIKDDNPDTLDVLVKELVPGRRVEMVVKPTKLTGEAVVIFARYSSKGDHRFVVGGDYELIADMGKKDFKLTPVKK